MVEYLLFDNENKENGRVEEKTAKKEPSCATNKAAHLVTKS